MAFLRSAPGSEREREVDRRDGGQDQRTTRRQLPGQTCKKRGQRVNAVDGLSSSDRLHLLSLGPMQQIQAKEHGPDPEHSEQVVGGCDPLTTAVETPSNQLRIQKRYGAVRKPYEAQGDTRPLAHDPTRFHGAKAFETPFSAGANEG